jgi:hypothetical protein
MAALRHLSAVPGACGAGFFAQAAGQQLPKTDAVSQTLLEIEQLAPKNAFVALTSIDNNNPKIVGGFHFRGSQEEAERIIGKWRSKLMGQNSSLKREKVQYQGHEIEATKTGSFTIATAYDPPWFFVATDAADMQALLDRADRRSSIQTTGSTRTRRIVQPFRVGLQRRGILLSAAKDVFAATRGVARCCRVNPGSR